MPIRLATILALLGLAVAARAQPLVPVVAPPVPAVDAAESAAEALAADAAGYAEAYRVPPAEAVRRLEAQEASVPLTDRLASAYADRLAGITIEHAPDYRIVLHLVGPPAPDVAVATAPFGVPVVTRAGALATRAATLAAIAAHQAEIRDVFSAPPGMGVDPATGALLVLARPGDPGDNAPDLVARLGTIAGVPVELRSWADTARDLAVEGGGRVTGGDTDGGSRRYVCTSGFVVTDGARTALSTAAHCPDALAFVDREGAPTPLAMLGAWGAGTQDVQIHDAGRPLDPLFHADAADRSRAVATWRAHGSTRAGDWVCHRGERTGYSCAVVAFPDFSPPGDLCAGPCPATWVAVVGPRCKGGDSGGPVFMGEVAFGLVKGESTSDGACRLYYYMSVDYLPPGWTVAHR